MNRFFKKYGAAGAALVLAQQSAHAALPTEVTDALATAKTDLVTGATAVIVAMVSFWGLRKLGSKLGWW